jgi:tryptophan-rich sensory protein
MHRFKYDLLKMTKWYKNTKTLLLAAIAILVALATMMIIFATTQTSVEWYLSLNLPSCMPPSWALDAIRTVLFVLVAASAIIVLFERKKNKKHCNFAIALYLINAFFAILFSILFFGVKSILYSFLELPFLLAASLLLIWCVHLVNKTASYILVPYAIWIVYLTIVTGILLFQ